MKTEKRLMVAGLCALMALGCGTVTKTLVMNNPKVEKILTPPKPDRTVEHVGRVEYVGDGETLPQFHDVVYGGHYEDKQAQLVKKMAGEFDVGTIEELARQIAMTSNLQTVIYDLTADKIWVANRKEKVRAADRPYVEFSLADAWNKSAQFASATEAPIRSGAGN